MPSSDSRGMGEDVREDGVLPDRAEKPLEKKDSAGDEVASDFVEEWPCDCALVGVWS